MESTTTSLARTAPTEGLSAILDRPGPFLTVIAETDPAVDNAAHRSMQRWRALRDQAADAGVSASVLDDVEARIPDAHHDGPALFVVADSSGVLLAEPLAVPGTPAISRWAPVPSFVPLLADRQARLPHVVVRCDREGADMLAVDADRQADTRAVKGDPHPFRRARSTGWQELRGWHLAERTVATTAEEVATAAVDAAARVGAVLVIVTGDDRTVDRVVALLGQRGLDARAVPGGRGHDGSVEQVDDEAAAVVRTVVAEHEVAALERFREQLAHDLAVEGLDDTLAALSAGRVDVLLVHDDGGDDRTVDEAVRAALATSAGVVVVPAHGGPRGAIGALLRWR